MTNAPQQDPTWLDMSDWPRTWAREDSDRRIGEAIIRELQPILAYIVSQNLTLAAVHRHRHGLYLLGSQVLDSLTKFPETAPPSVPEALRNILDNEGGPELSYAGLTDAVKRDFVATCRKAHRFLQMKGSVPQVQASLA